MNKNIINRSKICLLLLAGVLFSHNSNAEVATVADYCHKDCICQVTCKNGDISQIILIDGILEPEKDLECKVTDFVKSKCRIFCGGKDNVALDGCSCSPNNPTSVTSDGNIELETEVIR